MMKRLIWNRIKQRRKYILPGLVFLVWMLFFDNRNVFVQKSLNNQIIQLEKQYDKYQEKLDDVKAEYEAMRRFPEKYARERYYMHKPSEVVFIYEN